MTYTTDQAIALARESGANYWHHGMNADQLAALCNAVRKQTLLEAADKLNSMADDVLKGREALAVKGAALALMAGVE